MHSISTYTHGMTGYRTPSIDRIAREGALFTDYYGEQSCTAGRSAFITGQHPFRTGLLTIGMPGSPHGIPDFAPTLADMLKDKGYATVEFATLQPRRAASTAWSFPTAVDNMDPNKPFLRTLASLPIAPGVRANSIIAVKGDGPMESGDDGVVSYESAHIDGVESELVVRSSHSTQSGKKGTMVL